MLDSANRKEFQALERSLAADTRKGVQSAIARAKKRIEAEEAEQKRIEDAIAFERNLIENAGGKVAVGLDEVGRGPLAGPLTVGAVVFPEGVHIDGLDDSKRIPEHRRPVIAEAVKACSLAYTTVHIPPDYIDEAGIMAALRKAFTEAIGIIEQAVKVDVVLLDGNPMHIDPREVNVVKGDRLCPSISAASVIAKVERDSMMENYAQAYPQYGFDINKGYGTDFHQSAISEYGLSEIHRKSFCTSFTQQTLF